MGDRYHLILKCAWCEKENDCIYADEWGEEFTCEFCKKKNKIIINFKTKKFKEK